MRKNKAGLPNGVTLNFNENHLQDDLSIQAVRQKMLKLSPSMLIQQSKSRQSKMFAHWQHPDGAVQRCSVKEMTQSMNKREAIESLKGHDVGGLLSARRPITKVKSHLNPSLSNIYTQRTTRLNTNASLTPSARD